MSMLLKYLPLSTTCRSANLEPQELAFVLPTDHDREMKFGKQLELGIYEPWKDYYLQYGKLKRIIKRLRFIADKKNERAEKAAKAIADSKAHTFVELTKTASFNSNPDERTPLTTFEQLSSTQSYTAPPLIPKGPKSDKQKVKEKDKEGLEEGLDFFATILEEMNKANNFFVGKTAELRINLEALLKPRSNTYVTHHTSSDPTFLLKLRGLYVELVALKQYAELNKTGFYKIIKKYDKAMGTQTLEEWLVTLDGQPFSIVSEPVRMLEVVTGLVSRDKLLEWDRFATAQQTKCSDDIFPSVRPLGIAAALVVFLITSFVPVVRADDPCARRCATLLLVTLTLWVTEAIPYYATGILVPVLVTTMSVLKDPTTPGQPMKVEAAATFVMNSIFNHTTLLLLGGYTISTAFARCQLELRVAAFLQKRFGNAPKLFILAVMFLGLFLSMWISNHTAPILCATIILPVVRDLPTDSRFSKALLLGLAYACNYGGMMTPISSMQNVLAVAYLQQAGFVVTFGRWICVSLPFGVLNTLLAWAYLIVVVQPDDIQSIPLIVYERGTVLGKRNVTVIVSSLLTILMFANFTYLEFFFGEIGIVAAVYVVFMFGSGILSEVDFNSLSWHTIFLVGGGNVLGKAVTSSGLLNYISSDITEALPLSEPWVALVIILMFCLTAATFVSHTVASLILMPVISTLGISLHMPEIAVIGSAFAVSAAMALPFSSFPNVNSVLIVDDFQRPYLSVGDFVKTGLPLSVICVFLIATLGYVLIKAIVV